MSLQTRHNTRRMRIKDAVLDSPEKISPVDLVVQKFGGGLNWAQVVEMRDIFDIAVVYNSIYTLENIEKITVAPDGWVNITINNKTFGLQYYTSGRCGTYQFRIDDTKVRGCSKKQVAEFLVAGFDEQMERFEHYRGLYKTIKTWQDAKDEPYKTLCYNIALTAYKEAVKGMDWSYMMSDDNRYYTSGIWQEKTLIELGKMLSPEAEAHYKAEHDIYWNRVNST